MNRTKKLSPNVAFTIVFVIALIAGVTAAVFTQIQTSQDPAIVACNQAAQSHDTVCGLLLRFATGRVVGTGSLTGFATALLTVLVLSLLGQLPEGVNTGSLPD